MTGIGYALAFSLLVSSGQEPAPERKLDFLVGKWESKEVTTSGTQEIEFTLKGVNQWILGGKALVIDENFKIQDRELSNHIIIRWNQAAKNYKMWWHTNGSPEPIILNGSFEGEKNLIFEPADDKAARQFKVVYDILEPGHYKARLEMKEGDNWTVRTRAEYKRTSL